jgi:hypothetical protein
MKHALILAGAALAFAAAAPADAKPGHAKGNKGQRGQQTVVVDRDFRGAPVYGYQAGRGCPPGLAKKNASCLPPGQAKKQQLGIGTRYINDYGYRSYSYNQLPTYVRDRYLNAYPDYYNDNYYYNDGYIYRVDPTTQVVEQIIRSLIR